ncbi:hypothetical protein J2X50_004100 [Aminobacter sp. BE322]
MHGPGWVWKGFPRPAKFFLASASLLLLAFVAFGDHAWAGQSPVNLPPPLTPPHKGEGDSVAPPSRANRRRFWWQGRRAGPPPPCGEGLGVGVQAVKAHEGMRLRAPQWGRLAVPASRPAGSQATSLNGCDWPGGRWRPDLPPCGGDGRQPRGGWEGSRRGRAARTIVSNSVSNQRGEILPFFHPLENLPYHCPCDLPRDPGAHRAAGGSAGAGLAGGRFSSLGDEPPSPGLAAAGRQKCRGD